MGAFEFQAKVKPAGWAYGEIFTSGQATQLDANASRAPDTFPVGVTFEQDVQVNGVSMLNDDLTVSGDISLFGGFTQEGNLISQGETDLIGNVTISSGVFHVDTSATSMVVECYADFEESVDLRGPSTTIGKSGTDVLTVNSFAGFGAPVQVSERVTTTGNGRIIDRAILGTNTNSAIPLGVKRVFFPNGVLTADHSIELPTGFQDNEMIEIVNDDQTGHLVTVNLPGGGLFYNLMWAPSGPPVPKRGVTAVYIGGAWRVFKTENWDI